MSLLNLLNSSIRYSCDILLSITLESRGPRSFAIRFFECPFFSTQGGSGKNQSARQMSTCDWMWPWGGEIGQSRFYFHFNRFLRFLTDICSIDPRAIPAVTRFLALLLPGYVCIPSAHRAGRIASVQCISSSYKDTGCREVFPSAPFHTKGFCKAVMQSHLLMSALYDLSTLIREFGYAYYLDGSEMYPGTY